ncbi:helix-turn-helix domain-containing protein [Nonomuraea sp. H19]|uniref:helix-turn-helix domain-containing protein n=1 Tax=Nonomuraea sp. H19 TaxID=3452206 RepID=UPI003F8BD4CD
MIDTAEDIRLYRVRDVVRLLGQSRSSVYELIRSGRLKSVKEGRTRLVTAAAIGEYIALLEREMEAS